jgi:hypothetical protein
MKKAQIQLMESTVVMFVFFIMIMIGLTVYSSHQNTRLEKIERQMAEQRAIETAKKIISLPELECSNNNAKTMDCIEIQKLEPFKQRISQNILYYKKDFGDTKATIKMVYAPALPQTVQKPAFFLNADKQTLFDFKSGGTSQKTFYFPVSLWDKRFVSEWSYFGWLKIEVFT